MSEFRQTACFLQFLIHADDVLQTLQEPVVDLRQLMNALHGVAFVHRLRNRKDTLVRRGFQRGIEVLDMQFFILRKAVHPLPDHTKAFLDRVFESAADGHHLAYGFHRTA